MKVDDDDLLPLKSEGKSGRSESLSLRPFLKNLPLPPIHELPPTLYRHPFCQSRPASC